MVLLDSYHAYYLRSNIGIRHRARSRRSFLLSDLSSLLLDAPRGDLTEKMELKGAVEGEKDSVVKQWHRVTIDVLLLQSYLVAV